MWRIAGKKEAVAGNIDGTITGEDGRKEEEEGHEGELKLTGNLFTIVDDDKISHQYIVTLESVLLGKAELAGMLKNEHKFWSLHIHYNLINSLHVCLCLPLGHEDWMYSVRWYPYVTEPLPGHQPLSLLSASMDKTMVLWQPDPSSGVWLEQVHET